MFECAGLVVSHGKLFSIKRGTYSSERLPVIQDKEI